MTARDVLGVPAPKGSGRAMLIGGRARYIASSSSANARKQGAWSKAVEKAFARADLLKGPVWLSVTFRMPRPRGHYGTGKNAARLKPSAPEHPCVYPDVDKLVRCTLDALTGLAFEDDARIVSLYVGKTYAEAGNEGASIKVGAWAGQMVIHAEV